METIRNHTRFFILFLYLTVATISFTQCEATRSIRFLKGTLPSPTKHINLFLSAANKLDLINRIDFPFEGSKDIQPYSVDSPFTLPPYNSLPPIALPENTPPPKTPETPPTTVPTPVVLSLPIILPIQIPPSSPTCILPGPPQSISTPNMPDTVPSPTGFIPTPTIYIPSPPYFEPSPLGLVPTRLFLSGRRLGFNQARRLSYLPLCSLSPLRRRVQDEARQRLLWCVAKPSVPDHLIQEAMNYTCGSGADCASIEPNGPCFNPDSLLVHASYAFNSYWQRTKVAGGTCSFGVTAILVTINPSYDRCRFEYY